MGPHICILSGAVWEGLVALGDFRECTRGPKSGRNIKIYGMV